MIFYEHCYFTRTPTRRVALVLCNNYFNSRKRAADSLEIGQLRSALGCVVSQVNTLLKSGCFREFSGFSRKILCISSDCNYSPFLTLLLVFWNNDKMRRILSQPNWTNFWIFFQSKVRSFPFLVEQRVESMIILQKNDSTRLDKKKRRMEFDKISSFISEDKIV